MERFKSLLQRLQEVYYGKHQKSAIDIDLMLDYTRVMYADLLEWRKEFAEPPYSDLVAAREAHKETHAVIDNTGSGPSKVIEPENPMVKEEAQVEKVPDVPETKPVAEPLPVAAAEPVAQKEEEVVEPTHTVEAIIEKEHEQEADVIAPASEAPEVFPEQESIETISKEHSGISFEPPFHLEKPVMVANAIVEEAPSELPVPEEIPAPAPAEIPLPAFKPYEPARLFDAIVERKDIRSSIGINDKYLFLNELFNNHKSDYEETLDMINQMSNLNEAVDWIKTKVASAKQWEKEDQTVQGFYALLGKHFSPK